MIFHRELAEKVMSGEKTVTRRQVSVNPRSPWWRERCAYTVGKVFTVNPGRGVKRIGEARVVACDRIALGYPKHDEARREGFESVTQLMLGFMLLNRWKAWKPEAEVWRIEFELCAALTTAARAQTVGEWEDEQ